MRAWALKAGLVLSAVASAALGASAGISTQQARTAAPTAITGTSASEGSSLSFARADHQHGAMTNPEITGNLLFTSATVQKITGALSAANATSSVAVFTFAPTAILDANDLVLRINAVDGGSSILTLDKEGDVVIASTGTFGASPIKMSGTNANVIQSSTSAATATNLVPALAIEPTATLDAGDLVFGIRGTSGGAPVFRVSKEGSVVIGDTLSVSNIISAAAFSGGGWDISGSVLQGQTAGISLDDTSGDVFAPGNIAATSDVSGGTITTAGLASTGSLKIGSGTTILKHLSGTASLDYDLSGAGITCQDLTITVTGAADGDVVSVGIPNALASTAGVQFSWWVSAANTVKVRACDVTSSNPNPAAATVRADVWQH